MLIVCSITMAFFLLLGVIFSCGKGGSLIAGYNSSSSEEKAKYDEKALCRGAGVLVLAILACLELSFAGAVLGSMPLLWTGLALTALAAAGGVIYLNTSRRFKKT